MGSYLSTTVGFGYSLGSWDSGWANDEVEEFFTVPDVEGLDVEDVLWPQTAEETWEEYWKRRKALQATSCLVIEFSGPTNYYADAHILHRESVTSILGDYGTLLEVHRFKDKLAQWEMEMSEELRNLGFPFSSLPLAEWLVLASYG